MRRAAAVLGLGIVLVVGGGRASGAALFPLQASTNGRYLVDQAGAPFFMVGDAAQSAAGALTYTQFQSYVDTRAGQGFNTINVNFVEHYYAPSPPADREGNQPFATPGDFSTPNDAYFAGLEQKVAYAASKGVLVSLAFYLGSGDHHEGWYVELTSASNTRAVCYAFGQYLANGRGAFGGLKKYANVMWTWGADQYLSDVEARARLHNVAQGVKDAGSTQLMSGDWGIIGLAAGLATIQDGFRTYVDLESVYAYENSGGIVETSRAGYVYDPGSADGDARGLPALPAFMKETGYEGESNPSPDPPAIRKYGWTAILNGCTAGYWYGHRDVWNFAYATSGYAVGVVWPLSPWTTSVTSTGAQDVAQLANLIGSIEWWRLVPSGTEAPFVGRVLVPGNDTSTGGAVSAAQTSDGTVLLAYVPSTGSGALTLMVDPRSMAGTARARWWDPTAGTFTNAGTVANTGTQALTTPGANAAGANDWLLVLQTALAGLTHVGVAVGGLEQDLAYDPFTRTFSGLVNGVSAGAQVLTATAYTGALAVGTGTAQATVAAETATPVSVTIYDTTGPPPVPDHAPVVLTMVVPNDPVTVGAQETLSATAMDADGDPIAFAWTSSPTGCGTFSTPAAPATQWTAATTGTCIITVTVTANGKNDARVASILVTAGATQGRAARGPARNARSHPTRP